MKYGKDYRKLILRVLRIDQQAAAYLAGKAPTPSADYPCNPPLERSPTMLTVKIAYRRIGDSPDTLPHTYSVEAQSQLAAANEITRFSLDNLDAEILAVTIDHECARAFAIIGYLRIPTASADAVSAQSLQIAQHLELSLCEYLDELHIQVDECQVRLTERQA